MKAIVKCSSGNSYEIECIIDVTFVCGTLCLISLDENLVAHTHKYTADSLACGNVKLIW